MILTVDNLGNILAQLPQDFVVTQTGSSAVVRFPGSLYGLNIRCFTSRDGTVYYSIIISQFSPMVIEPVEIFGYDPGMPELRVENEIRADILRIQAMIQGGREIEPYLTPEGNAFRSE